MQNLYAEGEVMDESRYLINFDTETFPGEYYDVIIIGSGIAGVYTALEMPDEYKVAILTKQTIEVSSSVLAQGGIAVSLGKHDSPKSHFEDTLYAGAGLCNEESVKVLVNSAESNIKRVVNYGVVFDKAKDNEKHLSLTREGAHSQNRIIHAGDSTGKEVLDKLIVAVNKKENVTIKERTIVVDLITEDGVCKGIIAHDDDTKEYKIYYSHVIICASGGYGNIYSGTTNPEVATGDGAAMAYRAGAELMDMEFVQFHPTVLHHPENSSFLISEAVRGEGAKLYNSKGERFMERYHELLELAPRDVVSRAIYNEMLETDSENVVLDITFKGKEYLEQRFPMIYKTCLEYGIDMAKDYIPVAPAEHYCMGGIKTDVYGRTNIKGFYACGESACTGIHGANRLASNSLLEGLVFGKRISEEVNEVIKSSGKYEKPVIKYNNDKKKRDFNSREYISKIQKMMTKNVGIIRSKQGLEEALSLVKKVADMADDTLNETLSDVELQNVITSATLVINAAIEREESRGAHYRTDFPEKDDVNWRRNIIVKREV